MKFQDFKSKVDLSMEDICREIFYENRDTIKVKKEAVVVKNLVTIYNATLQISNEKGFHAMSLRELAEKTNLSLGGLYAYFKNKEQLFEIIREQGYRITGKLLAEAIKTCDDAAEKLDIAIRTHLYLTEILQPWFYFFYMEAKNLSKEEQKKAIASELYTERIFTDILEAGVAQGVFEKGPDMTMTAAMIKAMLQDWYLKRWKYSRRQISVDAYADFVFGVAIKYILKSAC